MNENLGPGEKLRAWAKRGPGDDDHQMPVLLQNHRDKIHERNSEGYDAFLIAVKNKHLTIIEQLCDNGANVNTTYTIDEDVDCFTPLMMLASVGSSKETMQLIIRTGADINACDSDDKSALTYAVDFIDPGAVKLLLLANISAERIPDAQRALSSIEARETTEYKTIHLMLNAATMSEEQTEMQSFVDLISNAAPEACASALEVAMARGHYRAALLLAVRTHQNDDSADQEKIRLLLNMIALKQQLLPEGSRDRSIYAHARELAQDKPNIQAIIDATDPTCMRRGAQSSG